MTRHLSMELASQDLVCRSVLPVEIQTWEGEGREQVLRVPVTVARSGCIILALCLCVFLRVDDSDLYVKRGGQPG